MLVNPPSDANLQTSDITTNNFSTAKHGFVPKGTNVGSFLKDDGTWASVPGGGDALTSNPLSQFAPTTSLQLKGVLSDETGSGALVFGTSPNITTPTGIVKGDVGLGNVDNVQQQPLDSDLTTIAGLTATTDNFMVATASAWASRTPSQARTQMGLGALATLATVGTSQIDNDAVTFAKMQNIATDRLLGRDTASTGDPEELTVGGGIEFTGSAGIQTSALTGDVTKAAGGTSLVLAKNPKNCLINGNMNIWQRNVTFANNDDTFTADRWNFLTETNAAWTVARDTDVPSTGGSHYSMKCSKTATGANAQMAIVQILEAKDAIPLFGGVVSASFWAKTVGTEIANLRCALLSWSSTEDVVTSDVIGTWAQDGTDPTFATNWTKENTPSNLALTSSWQQFKVENVAIDTASTKNVALIIWVDDGTIATGDDFFVTQVQLNVGATALPFEYRTFEEELRHCQRYYEKSYPYHEFAGQSYADLYYGGAAHARDNGGANAFIMPTAIFRVQKRVAPTMAWYNPTTGAGPTHARSGGSTGVNYTSLTTNYSDATHAVFGLTLTNNDFHLGACWEAPAEL